MDNLVGPLIIRTGGEANGEEREDVVDEVDQSVVAEVEAVVVVKADRGAVLDHMILWLVIAVGCSSASRAAVASQRSTAY